MVTPEARRQQRQREGGEGGGCCGCGSVMVDGWTEEMTRVQSRTFIFLIRLSVCYNLRVPEHTWTGQHPLSVRGNRHYGGRHAVTSFQHPTHRESMSRNYSLQRTTTVYFVFLSLCVRVWLPSNSRHKMEMSTFLHYLVLGSSRLGGALSTPQRTHPFSVQVLAQAVAPVLVLPSRPTPTSPTCR